jgi:hypothetical protein
MCWLAVTSLLPRLPGKVTQPQHGPVGWGRASPDVFVDESGRHVERLIEDLEQTVALALEHLESGVRDELDLMPEQLEVRKRVAVAAQEESRAADLAPVIGPQLLGMAWTVQRIRKEDEAAVVRLEGRHAGDPSTERLTTADDFMAPTRRLDEDGHRFLRHTARKVDRDGVDSSTLETHDVGFHRRSVA